MALIVETIRLEPAHGEGRGRAGYVGGIFKTGRSNHMV